MKVSIEVNIMGKIWKVRILSNKIYEKAKSRSDSLAITLSWKRHLDLSEEVFAWDEEVAIEIIRHEVFHAFMGEMCVMSTQRVSRADWEEICAECFAKRGPEMITTSEDIYSRGKGLLNVG